MLNTPVLWSARLQLYTFTLTWRHHSAIACSRCRTFEFLTCWSAYEKYNITLVIIEYWNYLTRCLTWYGAVTEPRHLLCKATRLTILIYNDHYAIFLIYRHFRCRCLVCEISFTLLIALLICDVIWENPAYGETKITGSYQNAFCAASD